VIVVALGKTGRVVEAARGGRYRVEVGAMVVACREQELTPAEPPRGKKPTRRTPAQAMPAETVIHRPGNARPQALASLDLHGLRPEDALLRVEEGLDAAIRAGLDRVDIIHGRGAGRLKKRLHHYLASVGAVTHFEVDPSNPGVTIVRL
jgi:DNA mismatch repair protein MutS2